MGDLFNFIRLVESDSWYHLFQYLEDHQKYRKTSEVIRFHHYYKILWEYELLL